MGGLTQFGQQSTQFWGRLSSGGKFLYGVTALLLLSLVVWVGSWAMTGQYAVLFSGLHADDAAAIVQKLESDHVPYQLSNGGGTILVPADRVLKMRMNLAVAGLPQGAGKGFELFDEMSIGATPFVQNLNYVRAIQGELARTIMQLDPVAHARVHIVQPDPTPFVREEKPVTASVVIRTKPGQSLSRSATTGVVALVAGSVKGLTLDNVTVVDSEGRVLSERRDSKTGIASSDQLEYQRDVEGNLASKAQEILGRLLGPGRAVVRVSAEMSFRRLKENSEKFDPDGRAVTHESLTTSKTTAPAGPKGVTGAVANVPPGLPAAAGANGSLKQDESVESDYSVSRVNRQWEEQSGTIDRLTIAVILMPPPTAADADPKAALGITFDEARELVKQAVGFKEGRDQIQVSVGKATESEVDAAIDEQVFQGQRWQNYAATVRAASIGIAALVGLVMLVMLFRRFKPDPNDQPQTASGASPTAATDELRDVGKIALTLRTWLTEPRSSETAA